MPHARHHVPGLAERQPGLPHGRGGEVGRQADAVVVHELPEARQLAPVPVPHEGAGLVDDATAAGEHVEDGEEVLAAARGRAGPERGVEAAAGAQLGRVERDVGPAAEAPRGEREQRIGRAVLAEVDAEPAVAARVAAELLEQLLRGRGDLGGQDQPGDALDAGPRRGGLGDRGEPLRVDHHVVVGAHHPRALGDRERAVVRPGRAGHGLLQVADADRGVGPLPVAHDGAGLAGARRVVDHHDVERPVAQRGERIQAPPQRLGPVLGRDLHREVRPVLGERVAPGEPVEVRRVDLDVAQHLRQPLGHTRGAQPLRRHVDDTQCDRNAVRAHQNAGATTLRGR